MPPGRSDAAELHSKKPIFANFYFARAPTGKVGHFGLSWNGQAPLGPAFKTDGPILPKVYRLEGRIRPPRPAPVNQDREDFNLSAVRPDNPNRTGYALGGVTDLPLARWVGPSMTLFYETKPSELAKWYREMAEEAHLEVAKHKASVRASYRMIAARWEQLARAAEAELEAEK